MLGKRLRPLASEFDVVLLDCPPSVSLVSESVLRAADALIVPVIPTTLSMRTLDQVRAFVATAGKHQPRILPFVSMVDRRKRLHLDTCGLCLADDEFLRTPIPSASVVERMGVTRAPVAATLPSQPAARAFAALWREIADRLGIGPGVG
jgi:cellulose biosynthesis protein BcsQ